MGRGRKSKTQKMINRTNQAKKKSRMKKTADVVRENRKRGKR